MAAAQHVVCHGNAPTDTYLVIVSSALLLVTDVVCVYRRPTSSFKDFIASLIGPYEISTHAIASCSD